ncbi:hypothetical protein PHYBLDRAFT_171053 [Phycomyces blakesleeanus NRRL 1555(-)]|uniref:Uncharacterized protein n=1 Tax=Phycomyces blakesleeanus (strain ATCC 8743b / DSM 1359 / FGSC 10004 / NBRC 33097 / NRRL 1555) TaxID=763407 RepID=A0A167LSB5_PHYB8|nr:hypothetical protein PHYBLDRAFT_171053 [Phycomyces blakesleeanus NRRL 1555(-)]OAD70994.1 hypothetical protein PHYBLDRAFT_171053 [Phycomyces blakesleeanus NRRL 1555(-)]|eukprot:XP_018289034.1 hypothetical protein PHYBLDRAFT_171053 [Phycomyces blakesleeanus NRRL 1555(-)]
MIYYVTRTALNVSTLVINNTLNKHSKQYRASTHFVIKDVLLLTLYTFWYFQSMKSSKQTYSPRKYQGFHFQLKKCKTKKRAEYMKPICVEMLTILSDFGADMKMIAMMIPTI